MGLATDPDQMTGTGAYADGGGPASASPPDPGGGPHDAEPLPPSPGFTQWARTWLEATAPTTEKKAAEYGSNSLAKKGYRFAAAQRHNVGYADALELGIVQYVLEKMDRVEDAMQRGLPASDDTWVDVAVYALMVGYVRTFGRWP